MDTHFIRDEFGRCFGHAHHIVFTEERISVLELFTIRIILIRLERISAAVTSIQILTAIVPFFF